MLNRIKRNKGFTLIEMIIALAIIGIMAVSFLTIFSTTYAHIFSAGRRSDAIYKTEKQLETAIAGGATTEAGTFEVIIGSRLVSVKGELVTKTSVYENGKTVALTRFVPKDSIFTNTQVSSPTLALEIYANEIEIMVGTYYQLEANKPVTWTSSLPAVASVDVTGRITGHQAGTAVITASTGSEQKTCTVRIVNLVTLAYVKGGQYVRYNGVDYLKLTGENGRVMTLGAPQIGQPWVFHNDAPSRGELEGDLWTNARRRLSGLEYWTKTKRDDEKENQPIVIFVKSDGSFDEKNAKNAVSGRKLATSLNPNLRITSGTGEAGSPYLLADPE